MLHVAPNMVRDERPHDPDERWWLDVVLELHQLDETGLDSSGCMRSVPLEEVYEAVDRAQADHPPMKIGVFGDPNRARADAGEVYCEYKGEQLAQFVRKLQGGASSDQD